VAWTVWLLALEYKLGRRGEKHFRNYLPNFLEELVQQVVDRDRGQLASAVERRHVIAICLFIRVLSERNSLTLARHPQL
jgi:hypothetical protein